MFYDEDLILQYKRKENCVATNFIIIANDTQNSLSALRLCN